VVREVATNAPTLATRHQPGAAATGAAPTGGGTDRAALSEPSGRAGPAGRQSLAGAGVASVTVTVTSSTPRTTATSTVSPAAARA
jgi:hypothetical protein